MFGVKLGYDGLRKVLKNRCGNTWYQNFKGHDPIEFKIPPLLDDKTIEDIKDRLAFNKISNRPDKKYLLTGFIRCARCWKSLSGANSNGRRVYQHSKMVDNKPKFCMGINAERIERMVMETIFEYLVDVPKFKIAIKESLKPAEKKRELEKEFELKNNAIHKMDKEFEKHYAWEMEGKFPTAMMEAKRKKNIDVYGQLTAEIKDLENRINSMPDAALVEEEAERRRKDLLKRYGGKKRLVEMTYEDKRNLLHWLFDGKDQHGTPYNIFVKKYGKNKNTRFDVLLYGRINIMRTLKGDDINYFGDGDPIWFDGIDPEYITDPEYIEEQNQKTSQNNKTNESVLELIL